MIISHKYRFMFVHIYKVAGMSVRTALDPYTSTSHKIQRFILGKMLNKIQHFDYHGSWYLSTKMMPRIGYYHSHITAGEAKRIMGREKFDSFYKFAFVRNPWDWMTSIYRYESQSASHPKHKKTKELTGFEEFLDGMKNSQFKKQSDFIFDENGRQLVDFVGRFENLEQDFQIVCRKIGIQTSLPHTNSTTKQKTYRQYYKPHTEHMVRELLADDIENFGYQF